MLMGTIRMTPRSTRPQSMFGDCEPKPQAIDEARPRPRGRLCSIGVAACGLLAGLWASGAALGDDSPRAPARGRRR